MEDSSRRRGPASLARLCQALQHAADEERTRLARQLHDSASQSLAAASMSLSLVEREVASFDPSSREAFARAQQMIIAACRELGELSSALHPPLLGEAGLPSALRALARRRGVERFSLSNESTPTTGAPVEMTAYRVVEQALAELFQSAGAMTARLWQEENQLALTLTGLPRDEGDLDLAELSLRQRALAAGGRLRLRRAGDRLIVDVRLPPTPSMPIADTNETEE